MMARRNGIFYQVGVKPVRKYFLRMDFVFLCDYLGNVQNPKNTSSNGLVNSLIQTGVSGLPDLFMHTGTQRKYVIWS